jgi:hypothetical protein
MRSFRQTDAMVGFPTVANNRTFLFHDYTLLIERSMVTEIRALDIQSVIVLIIELVRVPAQLCHMGAVSLMILPGEPISA